MCLLALVMTPEVHGTKSHPSYKFRISFLKNKKHVNIEIDIYLFQLQCGLPPQYLSWFIVYSFNNTF